ncbi:PIN domain-containing protein [Candidatus Woesearchaeota archaeon]|nr:PIN domain-containing protein [Candidatus Woesearchaeota archaeon]
MILDTSFLIDLMKNDSSAINTFRMMEKANIPQFITSLSLFELYSGLDRCQRKKDELAKLTRVVDGQIVIPLDDLASKKAGEIHGSLINEGGMIDPVDCMISGIALVKKEKVLTRNIDDFNKIKGLEVETY